MSIPISALPKKYQDQVAASYGLAKAWQETPALPQKQAQKPLIRQKASRHSPNASKAPDLAQKTFLDYWRGAVAEFQFCPGRKWRFDYAWPVWKLALEVEGGIWSGGRHTRGSGFVKDMEKYNEAAARGWRLLRVQPSELNTAKTRALIAKSFIP